jgi:triphosphoribosyl-dephospho-CoA synthetase
MDNRRNDSSDTEQIVLYSRNKMSNDKQLELGPKIVHQKILELFSISVTSATNTETKLVNALRKILSSHRIIQKA